MQTDLYRYKGCGLDNVYLLNGYVISRLKSGEDVVVIEDLEGLHRAIAMNIVESSYPLDAKTFRFLRKELDMSQKQVAQINGVDEQTVSLWERARIPVPQSAELLLRALAGETMKGHSELKKLIERYNSLDREARALEHQLEFLKKADDGWVLKLG